MSVFLKRANGAFEFLAGGLTGGNSSETGYDGGLSTLSTNAVQNKVITQALNGIRSDLGQAQSDILDLNGVLSDVDTAPTENSTKLVQSGGVYSALNSAVVDLETDLSNLTDQLSSEISRAELAETNLQDDIQAIDGRLKPTVTDEDQAIPESEIDNKIAASVNNKADRSDLLDYYNNVSLHDNNAVPVSDNTTAIVGLGVTETEDGQKGLQGNYLTFGFIHDTYSKSKYDAVPTDGSDEAVTSNGVYDALQTKQDINYVSTIGSITNATIEEAIDSVADIVPSDASSSNKLALDSDVQSLQERVETLESEIPIEYTVNGTSDASGRYYKVTVSYTPNPTGSIQGYLSGTLNIQDRLGSKFCIPIANGNYRNDTAYWFPGFERRSRSGTARLNDIAWCGYDGSWTTSFIVKTGQWDNDAITFDNSYTNYNSSGVLSIHIEVEESDESAFNAATLVYFRDITSPHQKSMTIPAASSSWQVFKFSQGSITAGQLPVIVGTYAGGYYNTFIVNRFDSYSFSDRTNWITNIVCSEAAVSEAYIAFRNTATVQTTYTFTEMGNFNMEVTYQGAMSEDDMKTLLGISTVENSLSQVRRRILFDTTTTTGATLTTTRDLFGLEGVLDVCGWNTAGNSYRNRYFLSYNPRNNGPVIKLMQSGLGEVSSNPISAISATRSGTEVTLSITADSAYNIGTAVRFDAD